MPGCCANDNRRFFNRKLARHDLRRYRRRGLNRTERDLVALAGDVADATVLEVGGGIGALQLELLNAGAATATNVELSDGYEDAAADLFTGRDVERRIGDYVETDVPPHDIVVMHRVICCYPDADALVGKAAENTRRRLVLTYPRERAVIRVGVRTVNFFFRVRSCAFRVYVHPYSAIAAAAGEAGLQLERRLPGRFWESSSFVRL